MTPEDVLVERDRALENGDDARLLELAWVAEMLHRSPEEWEWERLRRPWERLWSEHFADFGFAGAEWRALAAHVFRDPPEYRAAAERHLKSWGDGNDAVTTSGERK